MTLPEIPIPTVKTLPCINCITLSVCKAIFEENQTKHHRQAQVVSSIFVLTSKNRCSSIRKYIETYPVNFGVNYHAIKFTQFFLKGEI